MPNSPKKIEDRLERMLNSWRSLAPDKSFGEMTLAQFEAAVAPAQEARQQVVKNKALYINSITARDLAYDEIADTMKQVVRGVLADPDYGPDSTLYEGFGYTRESERKSGLTRKGNLKPVTNEPTK